MRSERTEQERLAALLEYGILDTGPEPAFDRLTAVAAHLLRVPIALISFLDGERQWIKSGVGTDIRELPQAMTLCKYMLERPNSPPASMVVLDALADKRFSSNPLVVGAPHVRFYAAVPILTPAGAVIGSMCVIDPKARLEVADADLVSLVELAKVVMDLLEARREGFKRTAATLHAAHVEAVLAIIARSADLRTALEGTMAEMATVHSATSGVLLYRISRDVPLSQVAAIGNTPRTTQTWEDCEVLPSSPNIWGSNLDSAGESCLLADQPVMITLHASGPFARDPIAASARAHGARHLLALPFVAGAEEYCILLAFAHDTIDLVATKSLLALLRSALASKADGERLGLLGLALDMANEGVIVTYPNLEDDHPRIRYVNQSLCRLTGYASSELLGQPATILQGSESDIVEINRFRAAVRNGERTSASVTYHRKDASSFRAEMEFAPVHDIGGNVTHYINILRDVTEKLERERREHDLHQSFRILFEANPLPMWVIDCESLTFVQVNKAATEFYGWSEEQFLSMTLHDIRPAREMAHVHEALRASLHGTAASRIWTHLRADGSTVRMGGAIKPHHALGKHALLGVVWDMTEVEAAREQIDRNNRMLRELADGLLEKSTELTEVHRLALLGTWWLSRDRREMKWSDEVYKLIGRDVGDFPPSLENGLSVLHPDDRKLLDDPAGALKVGPGGGILEVRVVRPDGRLRYARIETRADVSNNLDKGLFGYVQDVTERRETEQALMRSERLAILGHLTGGVAHDFNNLLTVVMLNLEEAIAELSEESELQDILGPALQAAQRGSELTNQLLAYARQAPLRPKAVTLASFFATCRPLIRRTLGKAYELEITVRDDRCTFYVDATQLQTALLNIVSNAREAMPEGGAIKVVAARVVLPSPEYDVPEAPNGSYAMIAVFDHGRGIAREALPSVFEPFYTTKASGAGSGLGLSMVDGFIRQSGGFIHIESRLGEGTAVSMFLPLAGNGSATNVQDAIRERKPRALLVEDQPSVLATVSRMFHQLGYEVRGVGGAAAALAELDRNPDFDVLFTDIMLPGKMNGIALSQAVSQRAPAMRILLTSGYSDYDLSLAGMAGAELLVKPYKRQDLLDCLTKASIPLRAR